MMEVDSSFVSPEPGDGKNVLEQPYQIKNEHVHLKFVPANIMKAWQNSMVAEGARPTSKALCRPRNRQTGPSQLINEH
jgi:hypothetical protein